MMMMMIMMMMTVMITLPKIMIPVMMVTLLALVLSPEVGDQPTKHVLLQQEQKKVRPRAKVVADQKEGLVVKEGVKVIVQSLQSIL